LVYKQKVKPENRRKLLLSRRAQMGNNTALDHFIKEHHCKVYTNEEINVLNNYVKRRDVDTVINICDQEKVIELPDLKGDLHAAVINWIEDLGDGYFRAGLSYVCGYPYNGGSAEWILKLDDKLGFKPLFNSACWEDILNEKQKD